MPRHEAFIFMDIVHFPRAVATLLVASLQFLYQIALFAFAYVANCCLSTRKIILLSLLVEFFSWQFFPAVLSRNYFTIFAFRLSLSFDCSEHLVWQFLFACAALRVFAKATIPCFDTFLHTLRTCNLLR